MLTGDEILKIKNEVTEKLKLPQIWQKVSILKDEKTTEVHIRDLQEKRFKKALLFLQEHYLTQDRMCEMFNISSCPTSSSGLLNLIHTWMKDGTSLEAVINHDIETQKETNSESSQPSSSTMKLEDNKEEIVGLLVCRASHRLEHSRTFSRFRISKLKMDQTAQNEENESSYSKSETVIENTVSNETRRDTSKLHNFIKLRNHIAKLVDIYEHYDIDKFLNIYIVNVHSEWITTDLSEHLMRAALQQANQLNISVAMIIITTENEQKLARKIGMKVLASFCFREWSDGSLSDITQKNDLALLMAMKIKKRKSTEANSLEIKI